jgi:putative hydrolase of the HAD superfamily
VKSPPADFRRIRTVTFDAGGTLLAPHPSVGEVYAEVLGSFGLERDPARLEHAFRHAFATVSKNPAVLNPEDREKDFWRQVVRRTVDRDPLPESLFDGVFAAMWDAFSHGARWRVFDGTHALLRALGERGYRIGVLSNWDRRLHRVLEETGLAALIELVIVSADIGIEKPDIGIFREVETRTGCPAQACLHVGDSLHHDLAGARAAGWSGLLVRNDDEPVDLPAIGRLPDLDDLLTGPYQDPIL